MKKYSDFENYSKDQAYWERNQLICALSKVLMGCLARHPKEEEWEDDWRNIVVIYTLDEHFKIVQMAWHIHDSELPYFSHLKFDSTYKWDGHTTDEKYERLGRLTKGGIISSTEKK